MHCLHHTYTNLCLYAIIRYFGSYSTFFETLNMVQASNSLFPDRKGLMSRRKLVVNCQLSGDG